MPSPRNSSTVNLERLVVYRHLAVMVQAIALFAANVSLHLHVDIAPLVAIIVVYAVFNGLTWWFIRRGANVTENGLFLQLLIDVVELAALMYFTGGATNPFIWFFLVPLTFTAAALPERYSWTMAAITSICYSVLVFYNVPLLHQHGTDFSLHVFGMWTGYMLSSGLIAYFAVHMNQTLRQRDEALAKVREQALRDERLVALGTLAAGAAHEMGTPLATMAIIAKDLARDHAHAPEVAEQLRLLRGQIDRCKGILSSMATSAGQNPADAGYSQNLELYLNQLIERWRQTRPHVVVNYLPCGTLSAPVIVAEHTLTQSIINILNNAADVSPQEVEVRAICDAERLIMEICDRGPGIDAEVEARAGELLFTTKPVGVGHGLGLFLAQSTISRLGGSVRLTNREGGGACTRIELPLKTLLVPNG